MKNCYFVFRGVFHVYFRLANRLEISGREFIPKEGGLIVVSNHASYLDPLVIGAAMTRRMTYMAKEELFGIPLVRTFVRSFSFPVRRDRTSPAAVKEAVRRLRAGEAIAVFPGGERARQGDGTTIDFKKGVGLLARLSGADIMPAYIEGTDKSLPAGGKIPKPAKIKVIFAPPLINGKDFNHGTEDIAAIIQKTIRGLAAKK